MSRLFAWFTGLLALAAAGGIAAAGPGTRFGYWDYTTGLKLIRDISSPQSFAGFGISPLIAAAGLALIAAIMAFVTRHPRSAAFGFFSAVIAGAALTVPVQMKRAVDFNPFIHDVTTDFDDPPQIVAAALLPRKNPPEYRGDDPLPYDDSGKTVAEAQREAFLLIKPIYVRSDIDGAKGAALKVINSMGMEILAQGEAPGGGYAIESVATSRFFGFKDDFIVRLRPGKHDDETRVDLRSQSRVGLSDLGANAKRVRIFMEKFRAEFAE